MKRQLGRYEVTGDTAYRGHAPGTVFVARLDVLAARRAMERGHLRLLGLAIDELEPGSYRLPRTTTAPSRRTEPLSGGVRDDESRTVETYTTDRR